MTMGQRKELPKDKIVRQYKAGDSLTLLSVEYEASATRIRTVLEEAGVSIRTTAEAIRLYHDQRRQAAAGSR